jgi:FkbM family methyltransferase
MSWRTHPAVTVMRTLGRRTGVNRLLSALAPETTYEQSYDRELLSRMRRGDCVWDVGANRGIYVEKLLHAVGRGGQVIAFEPLPANLLVLSERFGAHANVLLHQMALGGADAEGALIAGRDGLCATTRVVPDASVRTTGSADEGSSVDRTQIRTADTLVQTGIAPLPDVVKLDVEGAELDCLHGMPRLLESGRLRCIGIEIHYGLLAERGQPRAPRDIERLLARCGYLVVWTDRNHLIAELL